MDTNSTAPSEPVKPAYTNAGDPPPLRLNAHDSAVYTNIMNRRRNRRLANLRHEGDLLMRDLRWGHNTTRVKRALRKLENG